MIDDVVKYMHENKILHKTLQDGQAIIIDDDREFIV
jgi:hypothetical protein